MRTRDRMRYTTERDHTTEADWHIADCPCGWIRAEPDRVACEREAGVHEKKCKEEANADPS